MDIETKHPAGVILVYSILTIINMDFLSIE